MQEINFVKPEQEIQTLEDYLACLLTSSASLKTLGAYQVVACEKGLLEEDEIKTAEAIEANIKHLLTVYRAQVENVLERVETSEEEILLRVRKVMPNIEIPRKRKNTRKKKNEIPPVS